MGQKILVPEMNGKEIIIDFSRLSTYATWLVVASVERISEAVASVEYQTSLEQPNLFQSWYEFIKLFTILYYTDGRFFIYYIKNRQGNVIELHIIPNGFLTPKDGYFVDINGNRYEATNIKEIKRIWKNGYIDSFKVLSKELGIYIEAKDFLDNFISNNGLISGYLKTDKELTINEAKLIQEMWQRAYSGKHNAGKIAVVWDGLTYEQIQSTPLNKDFLEQIKFIRDEILAFFGVPKTILGFTENINRSIAEQQYKNFLKFTVQPVIKNLQEIFNLLKIDFTFDKVLPEDTEILLKKIELALKFGIISNEEARQLLFKLPPSDNDNKEYGLDLNKIEKILTEIKNLKEF